MKAVKCTFFDTISQINFLNFLFQTKQTYFSFTYCSAGVAMNKNVLQNTKIMTFYDR